MIKKLQTLILMLLCLYIFTVAPTSIYAHILKSDRDIGGVMHIDPEDDPIINEKTHFMFEIKDRTGKFNALKCDCSILIEGAGDTQISKMHPDGTANIQYEYIFTQKGIYTVTVSGKPIEKGLFQEFTLAYELRIDRGQSSQRQVNSNITSDQKINIVISIIAIIAVTIIIAKLGSSSTKILPIILICSSLQLSLVSSTKYFKEVNHSDHEQNHSTHPPCCLPMMPIVNAFVYITVTLVKEPLEIIEPTKVYISHSRPPSRDKSPPA